MRKIVVLTLFLLVICAPGAMAAQMFEQALYNKIQSEGVFDGKEGVIYAASAEFESPSMLVISARDSKILCDAYDDADGLQLTDTISFQGNFNLETVRSSGKDYLLVTRGDTKEFYTVENDSFKRQNITQFTRTSSILGTLNGKINPYTSSDSIYVFLNSLKERSMAEYTFANRLPSLGDREENKIRTVLTACADIMSFDIKDYNYDRLFKYVLYTHENFKILTDIDPMSGSNSSLGNGVSIVNAEYIDFIMKKIFRIIPEKPPVNNLISRGFCYNDGYYLYKGGFGVYFSTEIKDFISAYDLGGNTVFVIFSDIYYEGDTKTPEYSYAILQKTSEGYSLLRLGMGESLPSQNEIRAYSPFSDHSYSFKSIGDTKSKQDSGDTKSKGLLLTVVLIIFSVGTVGVVCSIIILVSQRK